ncbi:MAG: gluconokinase [Aphanocapsa sp. GSE-SYN-MK-11-07L]|jgi:gluconokinase|nr:gluconokinase [Aphanocapsa sp. GSE-SYN-MK-11-07L]
MVILVMGVSGSGKTTIGQLLASSLDWQFSDADDFHPSANIQKMSHGIPLVDADRLPWLQTLKQAINEWLKTGTNVVLACSALKSSYRQFLCQDSEQVKLVFLKGSFELIYQRLVKRHEHYMQTDLLQSQFEALEDPENALQIEIDQSPTAIVQQIRTDLNL